MEIAVVSPLVMKFGVGSVRSMEEELLCMMRQEELLGSGVESIEMLLLERGALSVEFHDRKEVQFGYKVVGSFRDPLQRQLDEARRIEEECGILMNSKNEWVRPAGVRHTVERM